MCASMASGDPDVILSHAGGAGHDNPVGLKNRSFGDRKNYEVNNHTGSSFGVVVEEEKPDMVHGALYSTSDDLMVFGHGVKPALKRNVLSTVSRDSFMVHDYSDEVDHQADHASDAEILQLRHGLTIDELMRQGVAVPMRFPFVPMDHSNRMTVNLSFSPSQKRLSEILKAVKRHPSKQLVIEMDRSAFADQFSSLAELEPRSFHAAVHEIELTGYQTKNMPIPLFADLQSAVPSSDQTRQSGYCSWVAHNNICSRMGSRQPLHLMADACEPSCKVFQSSTPPLSLNQLGVSRCCVTWETTSSAAGLPGAGGLR